MSSMVTLDFERITWPELRTEATMASTFDAGIRRMLGKYIYGEAEPPNRSRLVEPEYFIDLYQKVVDNCDKQVDSDVLLRLVDFQKWMAEVVNAEILHTRSDVARVHNLIPLQTLLAKQLPGTSRTVLRNWLGKLQASCLYVAPAFTEQEKRWFYDQHCINWTKTAYMLWEQDLLYLQLPAPFPVRGPSIEDGERSLWLFSMASRHQLEPNARAIEAAVNRRAQEQRQRIADIRAQEQAKALREQAERQWEEARKADEARRAYEAAKVQQQELQRKAEARSTLRLVGPNEPPSDLTPPTD